MSGQSDAFWGLLPATQYWREWFAWYPVKACDRWRWLQWVQRRPFYQAGTLRRSHWVYVAGRAHDYTDAIIPEPMHHYTHTCRCCGARFGI